MKRRFEKVYARLLCGCGAALLAGVCATTASANMLTDPGFENQTAAPNPDPTGIAGWANFGGAGFSNAVARTGTESLVTPNEGGGYGVPGTYQVFAASPGETFTFSGYIYTPNTLVAGSNDFAILQLSWFTGAPPSNYAGGTNISSVGVNVGTPAGGGGEPILPDTWTLATITAVAPAGTNSMGAYMLDINADANAQFYFDDMSLTSVAVPEPTSLGMLGMVGMAALRRRRR